MTGNKNAAYELFVLDQNFHVASSLLIQTDKNMSSWAALALSFW
jgi:hypothetical protein